jgi:hypothetical protein
MLQFVQNANDTVSVVQDGANVAGIARDGERFVVTPASGIAILPFEGESLASAQEYVARELGDSVARSTGKSASASKRSSSKRGSSKRSEGTSKHASKSKSAPVARERKVSEVMQRNISELAAGNYPVFVESAEMWKALRSSRATRALVDAGFAYRNGTGNIYPNPAQAKRIAKQYPGTSLALQCELGGYTAWRNSLRKRTAPASAEETASAA